MNFINLTTQTLKNVLFFYNLLKSLGNLFPTFEGTLLNRNVGNLLPIYAGSYPKRRKTSFTPKSRSGIQYVCKCEARFKHTNVKTCVPFSSWRSNPHRA